MLGCAVLCLALYTLLVWGIQITGYTSQAQPGLCKLENTGYIADYVDIKPDSNPDSKPDSNYTP